jgi:hydroxymethylbilane synthase
VKPDAEKRTAGYRDRVGDAQYLPLGIDVSGLRCLVVGGGRIGTRKALTLARAGALVTVLSPAISPRLQGAVSRSEINWVCGEYGAQCLPGNVLIVAATDKPQLNLAIREDCEARSQLCCVVSPGRSSRVIFPAVHRGAGLTVAVHSDGRDCSTSRRTRDRIAELLRDKADTDQLLCCFGAQREDLPEDFFAQLGRHSRDLDSEALHGREFGAGLILATCQRWEAWFMAASPEAGARELRGLIHDRCGLLLEEHGSAFVLRTGLAARHHLLSVACGLESTLIAETEIIGQLREARDRFTPQINSRLRMLIDDILNGQKSIRAETGLTPSGGGWIERTCRMVQSGPVLVLGLGHIGTRILHRLEKAGIEARAVSSRVNDGRGRQNVYPPKRLGELLASSRAVIITSASDRQRQVINDYAATAALQLIDLSSGPQLRDVASGLIDGQRAAMIARSRAAVFEATLRAADIDSSARSIRIGSRGSSLARIQTGQAIRFARQVLPGSEFPTLIIDTPGDRDRKTALPEVVTGDFFTRDLDLALLAGQIDLAIHSAKDLPPQLPDGLALAALLPCFAPWECLVAPRGMTLDSLPAGSRIGTSSVRRREWLLSERPDLEACEIRGNVPDRVAQMDEGNYDALILAAAGLIRLGLEERIAQVFALELFEPPAGQGQLALIVRSNDTALHTALAPLDLGSRKGLSWVAVESV